MIETVIVTILVVCCALYWLGRFAPAVTRSLWQATARVLAATGAPKPMRQAVAGRIAAPTGGCGSCKGCSGKGGGCH